MALISLVILPTTHSKRLMLRSLWGKCLCTHHSLCFLEWNKTHFPRQDLQSNVGVNHSFHPIPSQTFQKGGSMFTITELSFNTMFRSLFCSLNFSWIWHMKRDLTATLLVMHVGRSSIPPGNTRQVGNLTYSAAPCLPYILCDVQLAFHPGGMVL